MCVGRVGEEACGWKSGHNVNGVFTMGPTMPGPTSTGHSIMGEWGPHLWHGPWVIGQWVWGHVLWVGFFRNPYDRETRYLSLCSKSSALGKRGPT